MDGSRIAELGALMGDPTRAHLLHLMMDGRASTVGELARASHVAMSTASEHLTRMHAAGLVRAEKQGRYRYYRLAGPEIASLLESIDTLPLDGQDSEDGQDHQDAPDGTTPAARPAPAAARPGAVRPGSAQDPSGPGVAATVPIRTPHELRFARSCYDHLAGTLGVALHDLLVTEDDGQLSLAPGAPAALGQLGVDSTRGRPKGSRRPSLRDCLDWSERRPHLAGATGAALLSQLLEHGWVTRRRTPRALRLTHSGREALTAAFGENPCWAPPAQSGSLRS